MKKTQLAAAVLLLTAGAVTEPLLAGDEKEQPEQAEKIVRQTICPVMGGKINKKSYLDHDGKRIYLCCIGCAGAIKADPEKYIKKLEEEGITLDKVSNKEEDEKEQPEQAEKIVRQTICPVMGGKINKKSYLDHDGKRIYLCCIGCAGAIKADPEKYIKKLEEEGITLDKVSNKEEKIEADEEKKE